MSFIEKQRIERLLETTPPAAGAVLENILSKAVSLGGLNTEETAALIKTSDPEEIKKIYAAAGCIKEAIYGRRLVVFAPLYVSNICSNNCLYCGFRRDNKKIKRRALTIDEVKREVRMILSQGHKRILMLMGDSPGGCSFDYFLDCIDAAYSVRDDKGSGIRRINVEVPPLNSGELKRLSDANIGTYTVFQETYHPEVYARMHPAPGTKSDYLKRLYAMDEALTAGLNDVGIGALFGLNDYRFEVLGLLEHAAHLKRKFGVGPHTISVPRVEPASGAPMSIDLPSRVSDGDFMKIVAVLRCAVPYTGIILSTRETPGLRDRLFSLGVSQISAGSKAAPGGYSDKEEGQFSLNDTRSSGEVIAKVIKEGHIPSFCTGCYRRGRVGADFMELAEPGLIKEHCHPNALLTLMEYLLDYADKDTLEEGRQLIAKELSTINSAALREKTEGFLKQIENGKRDIYF